MSDSLRSPASPRSRAAPRHTPLRLPRRTWIPAAALGVVAPLWLITQPLQDLDERRRIGALLAAAGCPDGDGALIDALIEAEERFDVDPLILVAVAVQESTCRERVTGPRGSRGLLQLKPSTAREIALRYDLGWSDAERLYEAEYSVLVAAALLSELYRELGSWDAALSAYNLGEARYRELARRRGGVLASRYARKVLERRGAIERGAGDALSAP